MFLLHTQVESPDIVLAEESCSCRYALSTMDSIQPMTKYSENKLV